MVIAHLADGATNTRRYVGRDALGRKAGGPPFRQPILQAANLGAAVAEHRNSLIGQHAVRSAAVRHDLLTEVEIGEPPSRGHSRER